MTSLIQNINEQTQKLDYQPEVENSGNRLKNEATNYYQQVAINMRKARRHLNLTQKQVAEGMGIPRSTYKSLESGKIGIYCFHMAKWSKVTGYDIRVLTKGTNYDLTEQLSNHELLEKIDALPKNKYEIVVDLVNAF